MGGAGEGGGAHFLTFWPIDVRGDNFTLSKVLAYTSAGDGVFSPAVSCATDPDGGNLQHTVIVIISYTNTTLRDGRRYQKGLIFGKFQRREGSFSIQNFMLQILDLKTGHFRTFPEEKNCNMIF